MNRSHILAASLFVLLLQPEMATLYGQQEIGFLERFALAPDRREVLSELIPGTEEYFYFHCLHFQNEKQLADAASIIERWRAKFGQTQQLRGMEARQALLAYDANPQQTLDFLKRQLNLNFDHAPPAKDRAAQLPSELDNSTLTINALLQSALARDRSLRQVEDSGLSLLLDQTLTPSQLRSLIERLPRADLPGVVRRIAEELKLKDSRGFGSARLHGLLTKEQLDALLRLRNNLIENEQFVRAYAARLAPAEGTSLADKAELRAYLNRLLDWTRRLPPSQNSFKALVIGNLLRLNLSENNFDRALFLEYIALPRSTDYYDVRKFRNQRVPFVKLSFRLPEIPLPAVGDDGELVRRHLEHFFASDNSVDRFASYLNREYLERVFAQTKILYGLGEPAKWYAKLSPGDQKELRERVEIQFAPHNPTRFKATDAISLDVEVKNVDDLLVKIYEINTLSYLRNHQQEINTAIDLDGLVANAEHQLSYSLPADRRHVEKIELPELDGRGVWIVDLLGAGKRSRALIQKGDLVIGERLGDAGHVFTIYDENGQRVDSAHIEFGGRTYEAHDGQIIIPYAEKTVSRNILIVHDTFATRTRIRHSAETYQLQAGFLIDRQSLVAGTQAAVAINTRLTCNGFPISISLLEDALLTVTAADADGISTSTSTRDLDLDDGDELVYSFLVPPRLSSLRFELTGKIYNQNRDERQSVSVSHSISCNGIARSGQIGDFYLQRLPDGFRLAVLGRNGEPISRLPVTVRVKPRDFKQTRSFGLATNAEGIVGLGSLQEIDSITVAADGIQESVFQLSKFHRDWPSRIQLAAGGATELPLGKETSDPSQFSLYEVRRGVQVASRLENLSIDNGSLRVRDLAPGEYVLTDHEIGQAVRIAVSDAEAKDQFAVGQNRIMQLEHRIPLVIRDVELDTNMLTIKLDGADAMTRVHVLADVFAQTETLGQAVTLPDLPRTSRNRRQLESFYVNSLRLDEEYSYILNRQGLKRFPGNLLPQPSLLIHPWEVSVTENSQQNAAAGDAIPKSAMAPDAESEPFGEAEQLAAGASPDWKSFDFLAGGAVVVANAGVVDGQVKLPLEEFANYSSFTILAVHPTATDSRTVVRREDNIPTRDQRLKSAFDAAKTLAQTQRVEFLLPNEKRNLGDPRSRRLQTYTTLGDVFQLYSTLLDDSEWEKFRFVANWNRLSDEEKEAKYNTLACHELNFFLYYKDRAFFDRVVRPFLSQKLAKQLMDRWLLGESLNSFHSLWRVQRMNTLERILLADSIRDHRNGTRRWLDETIKANPLDVLFRQQRFEIALRGSALEGSDELARSEARFGYGGLGRGRGGFAGGGMAFGGRAAGEDRLSERADYALNAPASRAQAPFEDARGLRRSKMQREFAETPAPEALADDLFGVDRFRASQPAPPGLFQSLDKTKEWAETNFFRTKLSEQAADLIPPNAFWRQYMDEGKPFLPTDLDLPCSDINEALCALAVIDLPFDTEAPALKVENDELVMEVKSPVIVFMESIEQSRAGEGAASILVGQDIYLAEPKTSKEAERPIQTDALLRGISYKASVVVTNPSNQKQRLDVLTQLPAGSLPLAGSRTTRSTPLELAPYSTAQVQYVFYFPSAGEFAHYGAQISRNADHIASTPSTTLRVLEEPETVDDTTWSYVADWGTPEQVLEFLKSANLQQLDLSRIAFRMSNPEFYQRVTELLSATGQFEPTLWAYAVKHRDPVGIEQLLQNRQDFVAQLGSVLDSTLVRIDPRQQQTFEHLDYKPLVVARTHQLGAERTILNPSMYRQYNDLLDILAHQQTIDNEQHLPLCYYMLLQNRFEEALNWFDAIESESIETRLQYDYFEAYLGFFRADYEQAARIAGKYITHPVPRWKNMFEQIRDQVEERKALLAGITSSLVSREAGVDKSQQLLTDERTARQAQAADITPVLDLVQEGGQLNVVHRSLEQVRVDYYLMDIELLFSRNPFVSQGKRISPVIQPNLTEMLPVAKAGGDLRLELPRDLQNRNLVIEVSSGGISRSTVVTANALRVTVVDQYGQLQVLSEQGRGPVEGAYIKVYARQRNGSVVFYKDGYTDLRGRFDFATLSTGDLDNVDRFSILVLHDELGASVHEANPPTR